MPYLLIEDGFADNAKITSLSDSAFRLYVTSLVQSARNMEDGVISRERLLFSASISKIARPNAVAKELVDAGLWDENGRCFLIHDYLKHNPSRAEIEERRAQARSRKRKWNASRNTSGNASKNANGTHDKTHPIEVLRTSGGASSPTGSPSPACPECGVVVRPPTTLADHLWQTHNIEPAHVR